MAYIWEFSLNSFYIYQKKDEFGEDIKKHEFNGKRVYPLSKYSGIVYSEKENIILPVMPDDCSEILKKDLPIPENEFDESLNYLLNFNNTKVNKSTKCILQEIKKILNQEGK